MAHQRIMMASFWVTLALLVAAIVLQLVATFSRCPHKPPCCRCRVSAAGQRDITHIPHVLRCRRIRRRQRVKQRTDGAPDRT